jgi:putative ABC transport system permease protein
MIGYFLKIALINLKKHRYHSFLNITGLAIGFAAFIYINTYLINELSYDRFFSKEDRIFRSVMTLQFGETKEITAFSEIPLATAAKQDLPEVEETVRLFSTSNIITRYKDKKFIEDNIWYADSTIFKVFDFKLLKGDPNLALAQPNSILLSKIAAAKYFGDEDPLGKSLLLYNNQTIFIVTGILDHIPDNSHLQFDFLASFSSLPKEKINEGWAQSIDIYTYILVKKGTDLVSFMKKYREFPMKYLEATVEKMGMSLAEFGRKGNSLKYELQPLKDIHLHSSIYKENLRTTGNMRFLAVLSITGFLILVIACLNFINLSTASATSRKKEMCIKRIFGATRILSVYQVLTEIFLQCLIATLVAMIVLVEFFPLLNNFSEIAIKPGFFLNRYNLAIIFIIPILVTLLAGSYPAYYITRFKSIDVLKETVLPGKPKSWSRNILVTFQFIIFIVLVFTTITIKKQIFLLQNKNPGYDKENVLVIKGTSNLSENNRISLKTELLQNPFVVSASYTSTMPTIDEDSKMIYRIKGSEGSSYFNYLRVDADFQKTLKFSLDQGRFFQNNISLEENNIIINKAAAKVLGITDITSQIIHCDNTNQDLRIIGIMENINMRSLRDISFPLILQSAKTERYLSLRILPGNFTQDIQTTKETWEQFNREYPFEYFFLDKSFDAQYKSETRLGKLISIFTLIAILIACLGLLSLVSFNTSRRIKEIGIRKVNGAKISEILIMLNRDFVKWIAISFIIALPLAFFAMHKWLQTFAIKTDVSWIIFTLAGLLAFGIALLTITLQSWRAATINPIKALRYE